MVHKRHHFSFGLRLLFLAMLLISVCLAWLRHETDGRLVLESDADGMDFSTSPSPMIEIPIDADRSKVESSIRAALVRHARENGFVRSNIVFILADHERQVLRYEYDQWVRYRLDFWRSRYTLDYRDPVAQSRNKGIVETIESVVADIKK